MHVCSGSWDASFLMQVVLSLGSGVGLLCIQLLDPVVGNFVNLTTFLYEEGLSRNDCPV